MSIVKKSVIQKRVVCCICSGPLDDPHYNGWCELHINIVVPWKEPTHYNTAYQHKQGIRLGKAIICLRCDSQHKRNIQSVVEFRETIPGEWKAVYHEVERRNYGYFFKQQPEDLQDPAIQLPTRRSSLLQRIKHLFYL